jgi:hypothetical protein
MKQRARWCGRKEDQGAAQAAYVVGASSCIVGATSCVVGAAPWGEKDKRLPAQQRKAAWGQEQGSSIFTNAPSCQVTKLPKFRTPRSGLSTR